MSDHNQKVVEDYTDTCLLLGLINLIWVFVAVWAWQGLGAVLLLAVILNYAINQLAVRLEDSRTKWIRVTPSRK